MQERTLTRTASMVDLERRIGTYEGDARGPLVVCVAGIHGNESAGVAAARKVLAGLKHRRPAFRGRFTALAGNLRALRRGVRYVDLDLNRRWLPERVRTLTAAAAGEDAHSPAYFLDLHTSSAEGSPFVTVGDTLRNRAFALRLGLPLVLGLEEQIDGALLEYVNNSGHVTVGVEGGRHAAPEAVARHEAVLWLALLAAGNLRPEDVPDAADHRGLLAEATPGVPPVIEVLHRHLVRDGDGFRMKPGYRNFDPVARNELLAEDRGFFTVRAVQPFWLKLSGALRRWRVPRLASWLPGVRRHPTNEDTLLVDTRIVRFFPMQIFHLLGFRKRRWQGHLLLVSRRKHDDPPRR
jgi:succinylglutamate desuccinylase